MNIFGSPQSGRFFNRRCFMAVLALTVGAVLAPVGGAAAATDDSKATDKIIISGASGQLAGDTISELLERGVPITNLILVTRTPEKLASFKAQGAEVRAGDFNQAQSLPAAFAGARQLLLISTSGGGDRVEQHTNAINAARKAGVRHIVYTSFVNATEENVAAVTRDHRLTEAALKSSGVPYTILRNQLYSDGLVARGAEAVASGLIVTNSGTGKWAPVTRQDCAAAAAAVLATPGHEGKTYDITGPDLISERDFAKMLTQITGKSVRVVDLDDAAYIDRAVNNGTPEAFAKMGASFGTATRQNALNIKSETLQILIRRKPESVRDLLVENKAKLLATSGSR